MRGRQQERLDWLENTLASGGTIHLTEAARQCRVSTMTIRRDLEASNGRLSLLAGRILLADDPRYAPIYDLNTERDSHVAAKVRMARAAVDLIAPDDTIFIDCGTTLVHLANQLGPDMRLTVVAYALNVINVVQALPNIRLLVLGGLYHAPSGSFSGDKAASVIARTGINTAFISAAGVDPEFGISCFHFHEVEPKQAALRAAQQSILIADDSKIHQVRPALFARWSDFDLFITSRSAASDNLSSAPPGGPRVLQV